MLSKMFQSFLKNYCNIKHFLQIFNSKAKVFNGFAAMIED